MVLIHRHYNLTTTMPLLKAPRQRTPKYPVSVSRMTDEQIALIDRAAALRNEPRGGYIARVILREAKADLREAERRASLSDAAA